MLNNIRRNWYWLLLYVTTFIASFTYLFPHSHLLRLCWMFFAEFFPKAGMTITGWSVFFFMTLLSLLLTYGVFRLVKKIKESI